MPRNRKSSKAQEEEIRSLNKAAFGDLSIEELESRLMMEELDPRGEMWTGCGCASVCTPDVGPCSSYCPSLNPCPADGCVPYVCGARGTW